MLDLRNAHASKCVKCSAPVRAGEGFVVSREHLRDDTLPDRPTFTLCASRHCVAQVVGEDNVDEHDRPAILADRRIRCHDAEKLAPFLRAIGDQVDGVWYASPHRRDRDHVLRVAAKLGFHIAPELADYRDPVPVLAAVARAEAIDSIRPYQVEGVRWLAYRGLDDTHGERDEPRYQWKGSTRGGLLCDEQGTGKTLQTLLALHDDEALLVVCNKAALGVWVAEAKKWRPDRFDEYTILQGEESFRWPKHVRELVVINYDILPYTSAHITDEIAHARAKLYGWKGDAEADAKWARKRVPSLYAQRRKLARKLQRWHRRYRAARDGVGTTAAKRHRLYLAALERVEALLAVAAKIKRVKNTLARARLREPAGKPRCPVWLVADECHYVESNKALRTQRFRALSYMARRILGATGTPVESKPEKLWALMTTTKANPFHYKGPNSFLEAFNGSPGFHGGTEFARHPPPPGSTAKGSPIVAPGTTETLQRVMLRREKKDVAKDLPPYVFTEIPVPISDKIRAELDEHVAQYASEILSTSDPRKLPIASLSDLLVKLARACHEALDDFVNNFAEQGRPLVVFANNRGPIEHLAKRKDCFAVIGGETVGASDPQAAAESFQSGERLLFAGTSAAAESLTLTRACDLLQVIPFLERRKNSQAYDRIHRIGQDADAVNIYQLVPDHVYIRHVFALLAAKDQFVADVLHGDSTPEAADSRFVDESEEAWRARVEAAALARAQQECDRLARAEQRRARELAELASREATPAISEKRAKARAKRLAAAGVTLDVKPSKAAKATTALALTRALAEGTLSAPDEAVARWLDPGVQAGKRWAVANAAELLSKYAG